MLRRLLAVAMLMVGLCAPAQAEQKQMVGQYAIHYMALSSTFITPEIAKAYGISRSRYMGLVNITVLDTAQEGNPAVPVQISGIAKNLLDSSKKLDFQEIREENAIYYIAEVPHRNEENISFEIAISHNKSLNTNLKFSQKFYVD
ncbi:DUF4426 domain-containing protein [Paraferrimonas sedimenticola]|uniref:Outer membrane protein n=1 Tax=Paraferrimonas sedimenticola TaxID=375674 RepID=A0AA37RZU8_9GAMM|nr:DUF4426 domain-containing protein [Paraferrimonas sedimenticola]GLP98099.1 outer membrane protein [Paraferrimonas sedimenticola]